MTHIIGILNQKGGVGKTSTAINLSACLAALKYKTLLVDLDPQGNATSGIGFDKNEIYPTIYELLREEVKIEDTLKKHPMIPNLWLMPANINLVGIHKELANDAHRYVKLKKILRNLNNSNIEDNFDFIIIDCPPSLNLLTVNALISVKDLIVPIQCEYYAMEGVSAILKTIKQIKSKANPELKLLGLLLTMYDARTNLSKQVAEEMRKYFKDKVFKTVIPRSVRLGEAPSHGLPIIFYDLKSSGAIAYIKFTEEVLKRYGKK